MSEYTTSEMRSDLSFLHRVASRLDGWNKDQADEFIRVGEYGLALDSIAYAYLVNNKLMPPDQFEMFDRLASAMELEKDPEYDGVARLRASAKSHSV